MSHICGFCGCQNLVVDAAFPWQMCDSCYDEVCEIEDYEMPEMI